MKLAKGKFMNCKLWFDNTDHSKALSQRLAGFFALLIIAASFFRRHNKMWRLDLLHIFFSAWTKAQCESRQKLKSYLFYKLVLI